MAALRRWQIFTVYGVVLVSVWLAALQSVPDNSPTYQHILVDWAPLWGLILLGVYAVSWVVYGVVTLKDCPEAGKELEVQVEEARKELKRRGIIQ